MSRNVNQPANKETLAQWVSLSLKKALTETNIKNGFRAAGIYPIDRQVVDHFLEPATTYAREGGSNSVVRDGSNHAAASNGTHRARPLRVNGSDQEPRAGSAPTCTDNDEPDMNDDDGDSEADIEGVHTGSHVRLAESELEADFAREPDSSTEHFFVEIAEEDLSGEEEAADLEPEVEEPQSITSFLQLPSFTPTASRRRRDPIVDFAKSIILTGDAYNEAAESIRLARESAAQEKEHQKEAREETRKRKADERQQAAARKAASREESIRSREQRAAEKAAIKAQKTAEKETIARAKATRAYAAALEKADRAAAVAGRRTRRATSSLAARASENAHEHQVPEGLEGHGAFLAGQCASSSQFSPYVSPQHGLPFMQSPHLAPPQHPQFFFPSPSTFPPLSQFDIRPHSMAPNTQYPLMFPLSTIPQHPRRPQHEHLPESI